MDEKRYYSMANTKFRILNLDNTNYEVGDWYGISNTAANTQTKTVTITGFGSNSLVDGVRVVVRFTYAQNYNGTIYLNVSGTGKKGVMYNGNEFVGRYEWNAGQIVSFVYNANVGVWLIEDGSHANTSYWGKTKLSNTIANDSTMALTPKAVYDAGYATTSQIPTKTSDLNNDSGYITSAPVQSVNGQTGAVSLSIPSTASDVGAIADPSTKSNGQVLTYNGSSWVAQTPSVPTEIYYVELYGTVTWSEVVSAVNANKLIVGYIEPPNAPKEFLLMEGISIDTSTGNSSLDHMVFTGIMYTGSTPQYVDAHWTGSNIGWSSHDYTLATQSYVDTAIGTAIGNSY